MYDRPTLSELLDAVRMHLETAVVPAVREDRKLYFQTLVTINVLKIAERELSMGSDHLRAEWGRLNTLDGGGYHPPSSDVEMRVELAERNRALCAAIRAGQYDDMTRTLFSHLKMTSIEQLQVANPKFLSTLMKEDQHPELDAWHGR